MKIPLFTKYVPTVSAVINCFDLILFRNHLDLDQEQQESWQEILLVCGVQAEARICWKTD